MMLLLAFSHANKHFIFVFESVQIEFRALSVAYTHIAMVTKHIRNSGSTFTNAISTSATPILAYSNVLVRSIIFTVTSSGPSSYIIIHIKLFYNRMTFCEHDFYFEWCLFEKIRE